MNFDGSNYNEKLDKERLQKQHEAIKNLMLDGVWRTLSEINDALGYPESSISAQLRHLRKPRYGFYQVKKRRRQPWYGLFEYQVLRPVSFSGRQMEINPIVNNLNTVSGS